MYRRFVLKISIWRKILLKLLLSDDRESIVTDEGTKIVFFRQITLKAKFGKMEI